MHNGIYQDLLEKLNQGQNVVLQTLLQNPESRPAVIKRILTETDTPELIQEVLDKGIPMMETQADGMAFLEPFFPDSRLIILGGGHVALPLSEIASRTGFSVHVVDDRPSFANKPRFPWAKQVICDGFEKAIDRLEITNHDFVVIVTRGHRHDLTCLDKLLQGTEPFYTGMIGSRRRVGIVKDTMIEKGYEAGRLERLHSPIGLAIGAITPDEIAISILGELIAAKRLKNKKFAKSSDTDFDVLCNLAKDDTPRAVVTIISSKGSVPRGPGAKMVLYREGRTIGSIGGGCSEAAVITEARQIIGTGGYMIYKVDLTADEAEEEGMVCGGIMDVLIEDY